MTFPDPEQKHNASWLSPNVPWKGLESSRYEGPILEDAYDRTWKLLEWVGHNKDVLEIGCSSGYMSRRIAERGCRVVGVEIDEKAAQQAAQFCQQVIVADLNDQGWNGQIQQTFDVILMADVLEHLVYPQQVLHEAGSLLRPNGCLVISLPNIVHWITRFSIFLGQFRYHSFGTLDISHLRFFTHRTATEMIEEVGFCVTRFHPAIGGRMSGHGRPVWQGLAHLSPGLFAYQLLFQAIRKGHDSMRTGPVGAEASSS